MHVRNDRGPLTGRTRHGLLTLPATTGPDGVPLVAGHRWDSAAAHALVTERAGPDARLARHDGPERFDVLNLLVATDGATAVFGHDLRRLRPNLLISGVAAADEAAWPDTPGHRGRVARCHSVRQRGIVTSIDRTRRAEPRRLPPLRRGSATSCPDCWVIRPGTVHVATRSAWCPTTTPDHLGGWIVGAPYRAAS